MKRSREGVPLDVRRDFTERQIELYWSRVDTSEGPDACWPWTGQMARNGYGTFSVASRAESGGWRYWQAKAHRVAWALANRPIAAAEMVRHQCDNRPCCNPRHLLIGDHLDNMADMVSRGRQCSGERMSAATSRTRARGERCANARLTEDAVRAIRVEYHPSRKAELAERFGVKPLTIYRVATGRSWQHVA